MTLPTSKIARSCALMAAALAAGCEVAFVDETPPDLFVAESRLEARARQEPIVVGLLLDLHLADPAQCPVVEWGIACAVKKVLEPRGDIHFLPSHDVAVGCNQHRGRAVDVNTSVHDVEVARGRLPDAVVRPVFVYVTNIELPMPPDVLTGLRDLSGVVAARTRLTPVMWAIAPPVALSELQPDAESPWTFGTDPAIADGLAARAEYSLPFTSLSWAGLPKDLLTPEQLRTVQAFRVCRADRRVLPQGFSTDGSLAAVDVMSPPRFGADVSERLARDFAGVAADSIFVRFEACRGHCDRFVSEGERLVRWSDAAGCTLAGGGQ